MNTPNLPDTQTDLNRVLAKITEIAEKSANGNYIYRGESETHDKVSSNLYREYEKDVEAEYFDIEVVQKEILREAKEYTHKTDEFEILTELQHHGGKTNLIDFTTDYLVALFFACDGNRDKLGRVILLQNQSEIYEVLKPPRTIARAGVQKSIFVQSPSGVVDPDIVVCIPADLKGDMLDSLRKHHDISTKTIYNDLQGFIENRSSHQSAYTVFYKGLTCDERGDSTKDPAKKQVWYDRAVGHYTEAIDLNSDFAEAYNNRGTTYYRKGEFDKAIQNYNKTIDLNPDYAEAYNNRGAAYADKGEFDRAIRDYTQAIDLNPDYANAYNNRGITYNDKDEFDKAIQDYNKAIDLNSDFADAYNNLGVAYHKKGNLDRAIQDYNIAIELNPKDPKAYCNRGNIYNAKGQIDKAIQDYNKAIDSNPEFANAYYYRGKARLLMNEWEKAKVDIIVAEDLGIDIVGSFHRDHESIEDFEAKHGVEVPEDLAALLRGD